MNKLLFDSHPSANKTLKERIMMTQHPSASMTIRSTLQALDYSQQAVQKMLRNEKDGGGWGELNSVE